MSPATRRDVLRLAGAAGAAAALSGLSRPALAQGAAGRVVVVGGGFAGATAAKYIRLIDPRIEVTLIDRDARYITCPFSNLVLGGLKTMEEITQTRDALARQHGVKLVTEAVAAVDAERQSLRLQGGDTLPYDRLIVAPGIDLRFDAVEGYDEAAAELAPHAWKAGPQTTLLRRQLEAMPDGGTVLIVAPANPFRCPPGPYERASMIAHYLKTTKPKSKLIILDAKENFSKQTLFQNAWEEVYPGMIEWVSGSTGGKVSRIDAKTLTLSTEFGEQKSAVVNFIPPQRAGQIAQAAGLADEKGWCTVDPASLESTRRPKIHVIGDAIYAGTMPKSATAANSQAKACAAAVVALLSGKPVPAPSFSNTCYSLIAPDYGISITGVYERTPEGIKDVKDAGGVSPPNAPRAVRQQEALFTEAWYAGIVADSLA